MVLLFYRILWAVLTQLGVGFLLSLQFQLNLSIHPSLQLSSYIHLTWLLHFVGTVDLVSSSNLVISFCYNCGFDLIVLSSNLVISSRYNCGFGLPFNPVWLSLRPWALSLALKEELSISLRSWWCCCLLVLASPSCLGRGYRGGNQPWLVGHLPCTLRCGFIHSSLGYNNTTGILFNSTLARQCNCRVEDSINCKLVSNTKYIIALVLPWSSSYLCWDPWLPENLFHHLDTTMWVSEIGWSSSKISRQSS